MDHSLPLFLLTVLATAAVLGACIPGSVAPIPATDVPAMEPSSAATPTISPAPTPGIAATPAALPAEAARLLAQARAADPKRAAFAEQAGARVVPTADGRSFLLVWTPDGAPIGDRPVIATLHGHDSWAFDELFLWHPYAEERGYAIVAIQWWFGGGERIDDYETPPDMVRELGLLFEREGVGPGQVLWHGFSRGAANIYGVTALDRSAGGYGLLTIANSGGAAPDYPINRDIATGRFGPQPFAGTSWVMFCGENDPNPERDGCPGMQAAFSWVRQLGGDVRLFIDDPNADHGGFHRSPAHVEATLDLFAALLAQQP